MIDLSGPWQIISFVEAPAIVTMFGFVMRNARRLGELRVELADYRTHIAENYVPVEAQNAFEKEVVHRLERIEDKLDRAVASRIAD